MQTQTVVPKRTFGLEFEHVSKLNYSDLAAELQSKGIVVDPRAIGRGNLQYSGWQVKPDGSITPQGDYRTSIELASPPLLLRDYPKVRTVLRTAKQYGGVNSTCGLHVHVHAPELSGVLATRPNQEWIRSVTALWLSLEPVLFSYMPPSRRHSTYCRPGVQIGTKYMACNFTPLFDKETIEFRLHNATLNPMKAFAWAALCVGIVEAMIRRVGAASCASHHVKPKLVRTALGGEFYLEREAGGKWLIETVNKSTLKAEVPELAGAFKEFYKPLKLTGKHYLPGFHYPAHGNAISALCDLVGVTGVFKSYLGDRYDRMLHKHGAFRPVSASGPAATVEDEADFFHEPLLNEQSPLDPNVVRRPPSIEEPTDDDLYTQDGDDDDNDDNDSDDNDGRDEDGELR